MMAESSIEDAILHTAFTKAINRRSPQIAFMNLLPVDSPLLTESASQRFWTPKAVAIKPMIGARSSSRLPEKSSLMSFAQVSTIPRTSK